MKKLFVGVLGFSLAALIGAAKGEEPAASMKPGMILITGQQPAPAGQPFELRWLVYAWDGKAKRPPLLFRKQRPKGLFNDVTAFAVARNGQQYYASCDNNEIRQADKDGANEKVFFTHKTYVRDLALDDDDNVYFSEYISHIDKGRGNGYIYRIRPAKGKAAATAERFCTVHVQDMKIPDGNPDHFWLGNFAFARDAKSGVDTNTLYLSSGNVSPAAIFRMRRQDGEWGKPERVFTDRGCICGLMFVTSRDAYFVRTWGAHGVNQLFRLTDLKKAEAVLTLDAERLRHVSVVPRPALTEDIIEKKR